MPVLWYAALALLLTGCWNMGASKRGNQFEQTIDAYRILIRWGQFEQAQNYIRLREGQIREFDSELYSNIRVTRYQLIDKIAIGEDLDDAREIHVITELEFNHADQITVHTVRYEQLWWYDQETERWFLDGNLPAFNLQKKGQQQSKRRTIFSGVDN